MPARKGSPIEDFRIEEDEVKTLAEIIMEDIASSIPIHAVEDIEKEIEESPIGYELKKYLRKGNVWLTIIPTKEAKEKIEEMHEEAEKTVEGEITEEEIIEELEKEFTEEEGE